MPERKYRARWKDTGKLVADFMDKYNIDTLNDEHFIVEPYTFMDDMHGKEIYVGDIVRIYYDWEDPKEYTVHEVVDCFSFGFDVRPRAVKCLARMAIEDTEFRIEIIGDKYSDTIL